MGDGMWEGWVWLFDSVSIWIYVKQVKNRMGCFSGMGVVEPGIRVIAFSISVLFYLEMPCKVRLGMN